METPLVSVIVPVYKTPEQFLRACIESIQRQTVKDIQIILVDDGSPDKCGSICDEYATQDNRIQVLHQENGGPSKARNCGIKHVRGEYLVFIDADRCGFPGSARAWDRSYETHRCTMCSVWMDKIMKLESQSKIVSQILSVSLLPLKQ